MESSSAAPLSPATSLRKRHESLSDADAFDCDWNADLRATGAEPTPIAAFDVGVPVLALGSLVLAALVAFVAPDAGSSPAPMALALLLVASFPWVHWLRRGDEGPSWQFMLVAVGPVAALGIGQWFAEALSLGSSAAYPLLAFPGVMLVILSLAAVNAREAAWVSVAAHAGFGGPLIAAWAMGRDVSGMGVMTWNVVFALAVVAGYGVRLSYRANMVVAEAREALALQSASEERRQIARDVHDVVAHSLAVTMLHVTGARMAIKRADPDTAVAALEEAERQGRASLADIRRIVQLLRADNAPGMDAAQPGLNDVDSLVQRYRSAGLKVTFSKADHGVSASPSAELALFRVLQEALTNAARHGQGEAIVVLRGHDDRLELEISNSVGHVPARRSGGSGLQGMQERIAAAGGALEVGAREGSWLVRAQVPGELAA